MTANNHDVLTKQQELLSDMYKIHICPEMSMLKDCSIAGNLLSILEHRKIPYAWTLNLLFNNPTEQPYPSDPWVNKILSKFFYRMTPTNLATYPAWKAVPGFHTDDPKWQNRFAQEARTLVQSVDFLPVKS